MLLYFYTNFYEIGASKLASILKEDPDLISNKCLKILDISRCGIEDEGAKNMGNISTIFNYCHSFLKL